MRTLFQETDQLLTQMVVFRVFQQLLARNSSAQTNIQELFMNTLSRAPSSEELAYFTAVFQQQGNRFGAEGLQWTLLNKIDFLFNY